MSDSQPLTDAQILENALKIITHAFVGALTTVDADGVPHSRWMGAATGNDGLARLYTLTGRGTRKIEHIQNNPHVTWLFTSPNYNEVITLMGTAKLLDSPVVQQGVWDRLADCARTYGMNALSNTENLEFIVVETTVTTMEYLNPSEGVARPHTLELHLRD